MTIPDDEVWITVLVGAISELTKVENWEEGTGTISPAQASETAIEILESIAFQAC